MVLRLEGWAEYPLKKRCLMEIIMISNSIFSQQISSETLWRQVLNLKWILQYLEAKVKNSASFTGENIFIKMPNRLWTMLENINSSLNNIQGLDFLNFNNWLLGRRVVIVVAQAIITTVSISVIILHLHSWKQLKHKKLKYWRKYSSFYSEESLHIYAYEVLTNIHSWWPDLGVKSTQVIPSICIHVSNLFAFSFFPRCLLNDSMFTEL